MEKKIDPDHNLANSSSPQDGGNFDGSNLTQSSPPVTGRDSHSLRRTGQGLEPAGFNRSAQGMKDFARGLEDEANLPAEEGSSRDQPGTSGVQPTGIRGNVAVKKFGALRFIIPGVLAGLAVVALAFGLLKPRLPVASVEPAASGPAAGTTMASIDGGLMVFVPDPTGTDNNGQMGFWIDLFPKTEYQYSLCVEAGVCIEIPMDNVITDPPIITPLDVVESMDDGETDSHQGVPPIVSPDFLLQNPEAQERYCGWIQGHKPGEAQLATFWEMMLNLDTTDQASSGEIGNGPGNIGTLFDQFGLDNGNPELGDGSVHTGIQDDTVRTGIQDDTVRGLYCVVDNPLPLHQFARTSPYYDPSTAMANMPVPVSQSEAFCQNNIAYQTFDLALPADHTLASVNGDGQVECQQVIGSRVACFGGQGTNPVIEVGLLCDGFQLDCQPGSELGTTGCSNVMQTGSVAGTENTGFDPPAPIVPSSFHQLPNGAVTMQFTQPMQLINGVMTVRSGTSDQQSSDQLPFPGVISANCPQGFYMDGGLNGCTSLGALQQDCLAGYHLASQGGNCESDQPDGNYPGCPAGQVFDPSTGACDSSVSITSATQHIHTQFFQLNLPSCANNQPGGGGSDGGGSGGGCPPGQTYTCEPVCGCAPG